MRSLIAEAALVNTLFQVLITMQGLWSEPPLPALALTVFEHILRALIQQPLILS